MSCLPASQPIYVLNLYMASRIQDIFLKHIPYRLPIKSLKFLPQSKLYFCGEIHGARENADIIFTLCQELSFKRLALEYSPSVDLFIQSAIRGAPIFSLLKTEMFDTSVLSIEMLKTVTELLRSGVICEVVYIDETFDYTNEQWQKVSDPDWREIVMARAIEKLSAHQSMLCSMGNWHTRPRRTSHHTSALRRVRETRPEAVLVQNVYRSGAIRNANQFISLPYRSELPNEYTVVQRTKRNFELVVPQARAIKA